MGSTKHISPMDSRDSIECYLSDSTYAIRWYRVKLGLFEPLERGGSASKTSRQASLFSPSLSRVDLRERRKEGDHLPTQTGNWALENAETTCDLLNLYVSIGRGVYSCINTIWVSLVQSTIISTQSIITSIHLILFYI